MDGSTIDELAAREDVCVAAVSQFRCSLQPVSLRSRCADSSAHNTRYEDCRLQRPIKAAPVPYCIPWRIDGHQCGSVKRWPASGFRAATVPPRADGTVWPSAWSHSMLVVVLLYKHADTSGKRGAKTAPRASCQLWSYSAISFLPCRGPPFTPCPFIQAPQIEDGREDGTDAIEDNVGNRIEQPRHDLLGGHKIS